MFRSQKRMRPARGCDQSDFPGSSGEGLRRRGADLETAPGLRSRRVLIGVLKAPSFRGRRRYRFGGCQIAPVGVHGERHHRIRKPGPVPVKIKHRVDECVSQAAVQRLVAIGDVKALVQQGSREMLAAWPMATDREALVFGLIPRVRTSLIVQPWLYFRGES